MKSLKIVCTISVEKSKEEYAIQIQQVIINIILLSASSSSLVLLLFSLLLLLCRHGPDDCLRQALTSFWS